MAMTKKERAEFDAAILKAKTLAALRWTEPVERDVPVPASFKESTGWDFNAYTGTVQQKWSSCVSHGSGERRSGTASQNGVRLFSTELMALKALRHAVEIKAANELRKIDEKIAQHQGGSNGS